MEKLLLCNLLYFRRVLPSINKILPVWFLLYCILYKSHIFILSIPSSNVFPHMYAVTSWHNKFISIVIFAAKTSEKEELNAKVLRKQQDLF